MHTDDLSSVRLKPDLRAVKGFRIRRRYTINLLRTVTLVSIDAISICAAWNLAVQLGTSLQSPWTTNLSFLLLTLAVQLGIIFLLGLYKEGIHRRNYPALIKAISLSQLLLLLIAFLYEPNNYISRSTFFLFWFLSIVFICTSRFVFNILIHKLRNKGVMCYPVYLISDTDRQESNIKFIERHKYYNIAGVSEANCLDRYNRDTTIASLRQKGIEEVFVSWSAIKNRLYVCWRFQTVGITVRILPTEEIIAPKSVLEMIGEIPCLTIPSTILTGSGFWLKRCFDFCGSIILLMLFSPLYLLIALLIKLDSPGPIFFRQNRVGLHGHKFKVWKFRTMVANAEKLQATLEAKNEIKDGVLFKMKHDPRITRVGKFLRQYSLDELPQLFNVVVGEMSLVGPRPLPLRDVEKFKPKHFLRQEVLPGITGWWQVSGRSNIDNFEDAVKLDIFYIENWSFWLDIKILLQTIIVVFKKTGAY